MRGYSVNTLPPSQLPHLHTVIIATSDEVIPERKRGREREGGREGGGGKRKEEERIKKKDSIYNIWHFTESNISIH